MPPARHPTKTVLDLFGYFFVHDYFWPPPRHKRPAIIQEQQVDEATTDRNDNIFFLLDTRTLWRNGQRACKGGKEIRGKNSFFFFFVPDPLYHCCYCCCCCCHCYRNWVYIFSLTQIASPPVGPAVGSL